MKNHPNSLLCRFFGLHRLKPGKMHVLVMANVFDTERVVHKRFDLKGSLSGRRVSEAERRAPTVILKDLNFLQEEKAIILGPERKDVLMTQIKADSSFLCSMGVMDYSVLLGVHYRNQEQHLADLEKTSTGNVRDADVGRATSRIAADATKTYRSINEKWRLVRTASLESSKPAETHVSHFQVHDGGLASEETTRDGMSITGEEIYFVGIIDILQHYGWRKRSETFFKSFRHNLAEISAVDPQSYCDRFCDFMTSLME
jgi:1-phosphatidylinositol-4-phosphate 5-kinase